MRTILPVIPASILLLAAFACGEDPVSAKPAPVIEGWINSDGYPVVMFTASFVTDDYGKPIADKMIRWGKVTISDGETTAILTGGLDKEYFPPYRYYTFDIKGVPGRTYRIVADYEDLHAEAECTMPFPTSIDSIAVRSIQGNDSLRSATLHFTAPADCPAYFCVTLRDLDPRGRPLPAMMGCVRADVPGVHMELPLLRPKNSLDTVPFIPQFTIGQRYDVTLCRVSPEVYEFWDGYNNLTIFGGSQFVSASSSLKGNIRGGFGVWSAQGASTRLLEVK